MHRLKLKRPSFSRNYVILAVLALALYLPGFWWGAPHATDPERKQAWGVDDETPLGPLAEMHNIIEPKEDRNLGYPLMYAFVDSAAYAPYLGYLRLTGQWQEISGDYPFGMADPVAALRRLSYIASLVSVLMATGIVLAAYAGASWLWDERTGLLTAVLAGLAYPMVYYARTGNVDVPVLFYAAVSLAFFARSLVQGFTSRNAFWFAAFAGFALATKEPIAASFVAVPLVALYLRWRDTEGKWLSWAFWQPIFVAGITTFVAFGLGSGLFVDPDRFFAHVQFMSGRLEAVGSNTTGLVVGYPFTLAGHWELSQVLAGYLVDALTLPGLLLALVGLVWVLRHRPLAATLVLTGLTYALVLFLSARIGQLRYMMPVAYVLTFFAARAVVLAWDSKQPVLRYAFALIVTGVIGVSLLRNVDLTHAMLNDSRYDAAVWLAARTEAGMRVEHFGPTGKLPPLEYGVVAERAIPYYGAIFKPDLSEEVISTIRQGWQERQPDFIILMPDHSSIGDAPYSATCPPEIYADLVNGTLGYELAATFETESLIPWVNRPPLDYPTVGPPIRVFTPIPANVTGN